MWLEEEDLRRGTIARADRGLVKVVERGLVGLAEVLEVEVDEVVAGFGGRAGEDVVRPVHFDNGGILDSCDVAAILLGLDQRPAGAPFEAAGQGRRRRKGGDEKKEEELHGVERAVCVPSNHSAGRGGSLYVLPLCLMSEEGRKRARGLRLNTR